MTPFRALYDSDPPTVSDYINDSATYPVIEDILQERKIIFRSLHENLKKSRIQMENQANTKRIDVTFQIGD